MGFDIKCIKDILLCPAQYFCPLCRTLIYPNEALQTQCTHLYCKACLSDVANGSGACPYDGNLVTEADAKPLVESDKDLAEKIGNIGVRCLFVKSGCTWEGTLFESNAHCDGCSFGNLSVVCKRCGVLHLNKQASEHAQYKEGSEHAICCRGANVAQQAATGGVNATGSSGNTSQTSTSYQQVSSSANPLAAAAQTQEQWSYQQQYQQYQYPVYQPYPQPAQQYQQQSVPVQVQNQPSAHAQAAPQPHIQLVPPIPPQAQVPPQGNTHLAPIQSSMPNYPFTHPSVRPQTQIPPQMLPPPPHGQIVPHSQPMGVTSHAQHHQMPPYQHPPVQMHYPPQASQAPVQPQMRQSQPPPLPQMHPGNQSYGQVPLVQPYLYHSQSYARLPPPPLGNPDSMKHKGIENRDAGSSKLVLGGLSSAGSYKPTPHDVWNYRFEGSSGTAYSKDHERERLNPFSVDATRPPYHSSGYNVTSTHVQNSDAASRPGSGVSSSHSKFLPPHGVGSHHAHSGVSAHGLGEGFRSFNPSSDRTSFDHLQRGSTDGSWSTGDHNMTSMNTASSFHGMMNSNPGQGLPNALGGPEYLDLSRKRPASIGWCRLCQVDCETMERLDLHSQGREHQRIALDIVKTIKEQNRKEAHSFYGTFSMRAGHE